MTQITDLPNEIEGTWDEIAAFAPKFNGHRLRLTILPESLPEKQRQVADALSTPVENYADYVRAEYARMATEPPPTAEELAEGERESQELLDQLNKNRKREGAIPFF